MWNNARRVGVVILLACILLLIVLLFFAWPPRPAHAGTVDCAPTGSVVRAAYEQNGQVPAFVMKVDGGKPALMLIGPDGGFILVAEPLPGIACLIAKGGALQRVQLPDGDAPPAPPLR